MHPRRLVTTEEVIAIVSPDGGGALSTLEAWTADHDISLTTVDVGEDIDGVHEEGRDTLGVTLGGDGNSWREFGRSRRVKSRYLV